MTSRDLAAAGAEPHKTSPARAQTATVRLGVIDYLNVAPVYDWIEWQAARADGLPGVELVAGVPAAMNAALASGAVDVSNVSSVAFGRQASEWLLVPGLSVAAHGRVESVLLFSWHRDWAALDEGSVAVTSHSATSVALVRLLAEQRYAAHSHYVTCEPDLDAMLAAHDAALLIGDVALREGSLRREVAGRGRPYVFDLAHEWQAWTGLPFVFAVWAARADRAAAVRASGALELLRESKRRGLEALDDIAARAARRLDLPLSVCDAYLRLLDYELSERDLAGLRAFLELAVPGFRWDQVRTI
ncbi:MAG TPA: menaquinone biosynthesis protein [Ktedonobacterales bacterium]|nr:menaquinone biosynthesis protein [Ktedonobacterales bacterium]